MKDITVCAASDLLDEIADNNPAAVLSIEHPGVSPGHAGYAPRLGDIPQLVLNFWDSEQVVPNGPDMEQVKEGLDFVMEHIVEGPIIIHCKAGISRSAAMALGALSKLYPEKPEIELADMLLALRPQAAPNILMVEMLDELTGRGGKLVQAVLDHPVITIAAQSRPAPPRRRFRHHFEPLWDSRTRRKRRR